MDFYRACMNTTVINALGNGPLYDLVRLTGTYYCQLIAIPSRWGKMFYLAESISRWMATD